MKLDYMFTSLNANSHLYIIINHKFNNSNLMLLCFQTLLCHLPKVLSVIDVRSVYCKHTISKYFIIRINK